MAKTKKRKNVKPRNKIVKAKKDKKTKKEKPVKVFSVIDIYSTDILRLDDGREIKLLGVESPAAFFSRNRGLYRQALSFVSSSVQGGKIRLEKPSTPLEPGQENSFYVILPDGSSLNELLIGSGNALSDSKVNHAFKKKFDEAEKKAVKNGLAIWSVQKTDSPR